MTSSQGSSDPNAIMAARKYVQDYSDYAVAHLVNTCDPVKLLQEACKFKGHNYFKIMAQESDTEDDTKSTSSRRRTLSSNSHSALASTSSAMFSSLSSADGSSGIIWLMPDSRSKIPKTLRATRLEDSDCLIEASIVRSRLKLQPKRLSGSPLVRYNGGPIHCSGTILLEWAWNSKCLTPEMIQRTTFYVVEGLPGLEVVMSDADPQDSPIDQDDDITYGRNARDNSQGNSPKTELCATFTNHGLNMQASPDTRSFTENSTTVTAKQTFSGRAGRGPRERPESIASESSMIPKPKAPSKNAGSFSIGRPRAPSGRPSQDNPTMPHLTQTGLTSGFNVTILCGKAEMGFKLELNATGAIFFESLNQVIKKRNRRELNRELDLVRFAPHKDDYDDCCWVSLMEDQVVDDWAHAVDWFSRLKAKGACRIYAVVGPDDD